MLGFRDVIRTTRVRRGSPTMADAWHRRRCAGRRHGHRYGEQGRTSPTGPIGRSLVVSSINRFDILAPKTQIFA